MNLLGFKKISIIVLLLFSCLVLVILIYVRYEIIFKRIYFLDSQFNNVFLKILGLSYYQMILKVSDFSVIKVKIVGVGVYNIYIIGIRDIVGMIFYKNIMLFWSWYDFFKEDDDSGDLFNFRIEVDLDENRDVYIGIRLFFLLIGSYYVKMEKNLDSVYVVNGGKWV